MHIFPTFPRSAKSVYPRTETYVQPDRAYLLFRSYHLTFGVSFVDDGRKSTRGLGEPSETWTLDESLFGSAWHAPPASMAKAEFLLVKLPAQPFWPEYKCRLSVLLQSQLYSCLQIDDGRRMTIIFVFFAPAGVVPNQEC